MDDGMTVEVRKTQFGRTDQASNTRVSRFQSPRLLGVNKLEENGGLNRSKDSKLVPCHSGENELFSQGRFGIDENN